jgi:PhoH-like ATPase
VYTGYRTCEVSSEIITKIHKDFKIPIFNKRYTFYPNMYLELRSSIKTTALGKVSLDGTQIEKISTRTVSGITPRNKEQTFALDALWRDNIPVVALTGSSGTGKTLLALAIALQKMQNKSYRKVILTRPMSEVGRYKLGALPGDEKDKFSPYLLNYMTNLEQFIDNRRLVGDLIAQNRFEIVPIQLFRGASFNNCLVIADEVQVLNCMEILTIGTRIGENSKLVIMGDLNQRDERIAKDKTGIYKLMNDKQIKESPLVSAIELQQCERSETARLFAKVFEE